MQPGLFSDVQDPLQSEITFLKVMITIEGKSFAAELFHSSKVDNDFRHADLDSPFTAL